MMSGSPTPRPSTVRWALDTVAGSRASRAYLSVILALLLWVAVDTNFVHQQDASLAAVVPILATLPWGFAAVLLPDGSPLGYYPVIAAAGLTNAFLIGLITRRGNR
jgi:hypothetical protein